MLIGPAAVRSTTHVHGLRSEYVERCWTPVLGPGAVALLRLCPVLWSEAAPADIADGDLAVRIGVRSASKVRSIAKRLDGFGLARWYEVGTLSVLVALPDISDRSLARTTDWVREQHLTLGSRRTTGGGHAPGNRAHVLGHD